MTARQISRLYFRGAAEAIPDPEARAKAIAAADRQVNRVTLRPLKDSRLITVVRPYLLGETTRLARKEVVVLTSTGAAVVKQLYAEAGRGQSLRWRRDWLAIENTNQAHGSLLSDWYILLRRALADGWTLAGWRDDRDLAQLTAQGETHLSGLVPDAAVVLAAPSAAGKPAYVPLLLELDLGSETIASQRGTPRDWTSKIERYRAYFVAASATDPLWRGMTLPPRVLTLTTSPARLANLMAATRAVGGNDRFWFGTMELLRGDRDPVRAWWESHWQTPTGTDVFTLRQGLRQALTSLAAS